MNTKDGKPFIPGMALWGCYRDATGEWFLKQEKQFECNISDSYADKDTAIDFIIRRIRERLAERTRAAEGEIARWQDRQTQHCCGASGFNPMLGDECPACEKR